jgi:hypothetical protein
MEEDRAAWLAIAERWERMAEKVEKERNEKTWD